MSTTSLPPGRESVPSTRSVVKAPILASDILREEIAPLAPARSALRALLVPLSLGLLIWGGASLAGLTPGPPFEASAAFITAGAAGLAALIPGPYGARAVLAILAGFLPLVLGVRGEGPLALLGAQGEVAAGSGVVLATLLPASLFFRSQYRAFAAARGLIAAALVLSGPAAFFMFTGLASGQAPLLLRGVNGLTLLAMSTSLAGFLGAETTGGCNAWGMLILGVAGARAFVLAWLGFGGGHATAASLAGTLMAVATGLGVVAAASVASVGLYQLLAALFARRARMADVHQIVGPSAEEEEHEPSPFA
jgi:hypothetical protein